MVKIITSSNDGWSPYSLDALTLNIYPKRIFKKEKKNKI